MQHYQSLEDISLSETWLTIGSYDGIHRGHQAILARMVSGAHAAGSAAVVLTFFPHPGAVLRGMTGPFYLTSTEEKVRLMEDMGIDAVITLPFTRELASVSAADFMAKLKRQLDLQQLWIGYNFTLGHNREGDIPTLQRLGDLLGYSVEVIQPVTIDGEIVSSSLIRGLLGKGEVGRASTLLGRNYTVPGEVVPGDGRGRQIGIPTANLAVWPERMLPASGVYAGWAWVNGTRWPSVTNIGTRPTFEAQAVPVRLETHLLDFHQDLYGRAISVEFVDRLRDEQRFQSVDALIDQIHADIQKARGRLTP